MLLKNKLLQILFLSFMIFQLSAQVPNKMSYQAVVRNSLNELIINQQVSLQISIINGSYDGDVVYV